MVTPVQTVTGNTASNNNPTQAITVTAGNTLVIVLYATGAGADITSFVSSSSGTFTLVDKTQVANGTVASGAYLSNITGGSDTITFNLSTVVSTSSSSWIVQEYLSSDVYTLDQHTVNTTTGTNPTSNASGTTTAVNEVVIGWLGILSGTLPTAGAGYGNLTTSNSNVTITAAIEDKAVSSTGAQTANFTDSASVSYICGVMTFTPKPLSGHRFTLFGCGR